MRFFKLLKYDFLYGITNTKNIIKFIIYAIIVCFGCWQFRIDLIAREYIGYSLGDYFLYVFGGIKEYIPSPNEPFRIPYLFLLIHILILYLCCAISI